MRNAQLENVTFIETILIFCCSFDRQFAAEVYCMSCKIVPRNAEIFTLHQCAYFFVVESDRMCLLCFYKLLSLFQILTQLETPSRTFLVTRSGEELFESYI